MSCSDTLYIAPPQCLRGASELQTNIEQNEDLCISQQVQITPTEISNQYNKKEPINKKDFLLPHT